MSDTQMPLKNRCLLEAVGTFLLMFSISAVSLTGQSAIVSALAIAATLIAIVFTIGPFTGGHFNPAMSLGFCIRGAMPGRELVPYWIAQIAAAVIATFLAFLMIKGSFSADLLASYLERKTEAEGGPTSMQFAIAEVLFTFALVFLTINVAGTRTQAGNQYFGFVVGLTVLAGILTVGAIASAVFNPAVLVGLLVLGLVGAADGVVILISTIVGAILAAGLFKAVHGTREDGA